jgi:hypothetical protein
MKVSLVNYLAYPQVKNTWKSIKSPKNQEPWCLPLYTGIVFLLASQKKYSTAVLYNATNWGVKVISLTCIMSL